MSVDEAREMWTAWAQSKYPPQVVEQVVQAAMEVLAAGGGADAAQAAAAGAAAGSQARSTTHPAATVEPIVQLIAEVQHENGTAGLAPDYSVLVIRTTGRNALTRREWRKEERKPLSQIVYIFVHSRDRQTFGFDTCDQNNKWIAHVMGCTNKAALDTLMREIADHSPQIRIDLAHPSYGLPDPVHEQAKAEKDRAVEFNRVEAKWRQAAAAGPEVRVKTYDKAKDYQSDAPHMARQGWAPEGQTAGRGKVSAGGTAGKLILTGGLGAITGFSRKGDKITVTWVKQPPTHTPRPFVAVPDVPAPRTFPPEPYFSANLVDPVSPGDEYPPTSVGEVPPLADENQQAAEPVSPLSPQPDPVATNSIAARMRSLSELKDAGLITDEEYATKRAAILEEL
jgi:hypothetical protein